MYPWEDVIGFKRFRSLIAVAGLAAIAVIAIPG